MRKTTRNSPVAWISFCALLTALSLRADQLQMLNGDHYAGKILSLSSNSVVFESDVLGKVTLPREKISSMSLGASAATNAPVTPRVITRATNATVNIATALQNGTNADSIEQVRQQMLAGANPAANQKYNELLCGLMSGKLGVSDIRNEAKSSIDQINKLKQALGPVADSSLDSYLAILQNFVNETEPTTPVKPATPVLPKVPATLMAPATPAASFGTNSAASQAK